MRIAINAINDNECIRGPDRYLIGLLQGLKNINSEDEYFLYYAPWQDFYSELDLPSNFHRICLSPPRHRIARVFWHAVVFPGILNRASPDIVHLPNIIFVPGLRAPTVMTVHDLAHFEFPEKFGYFRGYTQRMLIHVAVKISQRLIAVSDYTRQDMVKRLSCPLEKIDVIGEGGPPPQNIHRDATQVPYFLYVGQIERSKNIETLIRAFVSSEKLHREKVELWIVGKNGNASKAVMALAEEKASGRVKLLGYVDESRLAGLYGNSLAFVFPSLVEGFGLVLLEAMAYGTPVIASNASVIPEVVDDAGMLVDCSKPEPLRTAMEDLCDSPQYREDLISKGRCRLQFYSWDKAARQTYDVYNGMK